MKKQIVVEKMNGDNEPYNPKKIVNSLKRVGANDQDIDEILDKVDGKLYEGIKTKELFRFIHDELKNIHQGVCCRYNLKKSMIDLRIDGGFVFEKFMGEILKKLRYKTELNKVIEGKFIPHEIDILAKKENEILMVEAKHHGKPWLGESIHTALYVYARFLDLNKKVTKPMLVTNTKFSPQVKKYSRGVGIRLMGWKYPEGNSLEDNIEKYGMYPISVLELEKNELDSYFEKGILTLDQLRKEDISDKLKEKIDLVLDGK